MVSQPKSIRIPLLGIMRKVVLDMQSDQLPQGLKRISEVKIPVSRSLLEPRFALEMPDILGESKNSGVQLGIFGTGKDVVALNDVYALGLAGQEPLICKVIKNDAQSGVSGHDESSQNSSSPRAKKRRKSFMTPTPLHIPESQVSPIPDSSHEMIYLKGFSKDDALRVVPLRDVVWLYPLISVMENPPE